MGESKVAPQQHHSAGLSSQPKRARAFAVRVCWGALPRLHVLVRFPSALSSFSPSPLAMVLVGFSAVKTCVVLQINPVKPKLPPCQQNQNRSRHALHRHMDR